MKQILHIFAKDSRHFYREILVSLAIAALVIWMYSTGWAPERLTDARVLNGLHQLTSVVAILLPVSWWLFITRVVHTESLVGDRQFWLTRPYEWPKLLAAKALFLVAYVYLPFVIVQFALLAVAGFDPLAYVPGLLFRLALITGLVVMPLLAIATVTSNFVRMTLTLLALILCFVGESALSSVFETTSVSTPYRDRVSVPVLLCLCGAAVLVQYASRRLWRARLLLIAIPIVLGVASLVPSREAKLERADPYLPAAQAAPVELTYLQDANHKPWQTGMDRRWSTFGIPVRISGVAEGYIVMPDDLRVTIEAANGAHWSSPLHTMYNRYYLPEPQDSSIDFTVPRSFLDSIRDLPVTLRLTVAFTQLRGGQTRTIEMPAKDFAVSGFGVCAGQVDRWYGTRQITGIDCRAAYHQTRLTSIEALWSNEPCSAKGSISKPGVQGAAWTGVVNPEPADFGLSRGSGASELIKWLERRGSGHSEAPLPLPGQATQIHSIRPGAPNEV